MSPQAAPVVGAIVAEEGGGARWVARGALTVANAAPVLDATQSLPLPTTGQMLCAGITTVDSAAVALLLALKRRAATQGVPLDFVGMPAALAALAALYGVEDLLEA